MDESTLSITGLLFLGIGLLLVGLRRAASRKAAALYRKLVIDIAEEQYAKQFAFVGVLFIILGFIAVTDMSGSIF